MLLHGSRLHVLPSCRRILVFPRGQKLDGQWLSIYLEAPEAQYTPPQMAPRAKFSLNLIPWDSHKEVSKGGSRTRSGHI